MMENGENMMTNETAGKKAEAEAEKWRAAGNDHFSRTDYHLAIDCYSRSLAANWTVKVLANRALAHIHVQKYGGLNHKKS
jgi:hypothetical protein